MRYQLPQKVNFKPAYCWQVPKKRKRDAGIGELNPEGLNQRCRFY